MNKKLADRIDALLENMVARAEHEVAEEGHEMTEDMVLAVTTLHSYKEALSAQRKAQMAAMVGDTISRALTNNPRGEA